MPSKAKPNAPPGKAEARRLSGDDRFSSIARLRTVPYFFGVSAVRALSETTYFAGLRKAGMPED
jgi:hypothetical protein